MQDSFHKSGSVLTFKLQIRLSRLLQSGKIPRADMLQRWAEKEHLDFANQDDILAEYKSPKT
jgi:hypothetical protein